MVVATLSLNRFNEHTCDVVFALPEMLLGLHGWRRLPAFITSSRLLLQREGDLGIQETRGQSNLGKYLVLLGSDVFVSESV